MFPVLGHLILCKMASVRNTIELKLKKSKFPVSACDVVSCDDDERLKYYLENTSFSLSKAKMLYDDQDVLQFEVNEKLLSQLKEMQLKNCETGKVYRMRRKLWIPCVGDKLVEVYEGDERQSSAEIFEIESRRKGTRFTIRDKRTEEVLCRMVKQPRSIFQFVTGAYDYTLSISKQADIPLLVTVSICVDKYYNKSRPGMLGTAMKTVL